MKVYFLRFLFQKFAKFFDSSSDVKRLGRFIRSLIKINTIKARSLLKFIIKFRVLTFWIYQKSFSYAQALVLTINNVIKSWLTLSRKQIDICHILVRNIFVSCRVVKWFTALRAAALLNVQDRALFLLSNKHPPRFRLDFIILEGCLDIEGTRIM